MASSITTIIEVVIGKKALATFLIALLLFPLAVIWLAYSGIPTKGAFYAIGDRLFYVPSQVVYYYFEVFPHWHGFLYGRSIDKFARLMGMVPFDTANYVGVYAVPNGIDSILANAAFIADLNADFGMPGVLVERYHYWSCDAVVPYSCYSPKKNDLGDRGYTPFSPYTFWFLNSSSLPIVLASNGAILALVISWWFDRRVSSIGGRLTIRGFNRLSQQT